MGLFAGHNRLPATRTPVSTIPLLSQTSVLFILHLDQTSMPVVIDAPRAPFDVDKP
jgi:hypothetical protein